VSAAVGDPLPAIGGGSFAAYFIYDVADTIDLAGLASLRGDGVQRAPLQLRRAASSEFIQFPTPPAIVRLDAPDGAEFQMRAKIFDYGVVSIRVAYPFRGTWDEFALLTRRLRSDQTVPAAARGALDLLLGELGPALIEPHSPRLEEYAVCRVDEFVEPVSAADLLQRYGAQVAQLILGEDRTLMRSEQEEALRVNFAYYEDELTVVHWETAFVYDRDESAAATEDILEFANTQLVELRTYDAYLDAELDRIYALDPGRPIRRLFRRRASESADQMRYLIVDVLEITDRVSNALKIIGDAYYARLYRGAAGRLGLADWQRQIDTKLRSVEEMYRFFQDQAQHARDEALELIIIVLILIEVVTGFLALRH
jgi:hypothetical protein